MNNISLQALTIWIICALFFLYEFFLRTVLGTYQQPMMQELNLSSMQFSLLSTTSFLTIYGVMQLPASILIEKYGLKKTLAFAAICCILACLGLAYSQQFTSALIQRLLMGIGASFGFIGVLICINEWFPSRYRALTIGLTQFIGTMGPMLAAGPLESFSNHSGLSWRWMFTLLAGLGLIILLGIVAMVHNRQTSSTSYIILQKPQKISTALLRFLSKSQPWCLALLSASLYFSIEYLSENEGRTFLMLKGLSNTQASYLLSLSWISYAVACPLLGLLSDWLSRRKRIMQGCALTGLLSIAMILYTDSSLQLMMAFVLLGISASGQGIGFATIAEQCEKQAIPMGFGLTNAMIMILAAMNAPFIGFLLDQVQTGPNATLNDYLYAFHVLTGIAILAVVVSLFFIQETFCKSTTDFTMLNNKNRSRSIHQP